MMIVLKQVFPLGRFHATPWRVNPFDDSHGEWPPSPWRLIRAVVARWYQWAREEPNVGRPDDLVQALCTSAYRFRLPKTARKGCHLRQYLPADFGWNPKDKKIAAIRSYGMSLAQDNYFCVPPTDAGAVWWFLDGEKWTDDAVRVLDHCLERITYFGRAETFTRIRRVSEDASEPNCKLLEYRIAGSVPVLAPVRNATRSDIERTTDDPECVKRSLPPGTRTMYAVRPLRPPVREAPFSSKAGRSANLIQFAIGWNVAPEARAVVRLTSRFRGRVLNALLWIKTGAPKAAWNRVDAATRETLALMFGKDPGGRPLTGHRHAEFLAWCENGSPTRLLVFRNSQPFDDDEHTAILRAAARELSSAADGPDSGAWKVRLVPLDHAVPPPPGFDGISARSWESVTPYVPPHRQLRRGKIRPRESLLAQIQRELSQRGHVAADQVGVEQAGDAEWVSVHLPRGQKDKRVFLGDRRGYRVRLRFPGPVQGPLRLGHSSSFGLGLFRPAADEEWG